jgi:AmmeMemoRadiSam system protein A
MPRKKDVQNTENKESAAPAGAMSPLVALAHKAVEEYVKHGEVIEPPKDLTPEMKERAGVFVSIHENNDLRGCIGTFEPAYRNAAQEIIHNAILASTEDPRFLPIREQELPFLDISVDVLTKPEPVKGVSELDAKKYGVIVGCGYRRGLLLPDLEGVNTPEEQINICRMKGGIGEEEPVKLFRFEVKRYH